MEISSSPSFCDASSNCNQQQRGFKRRLSPSPLMHSSIKGAGSCNVSKFEGASGVNDNAHVSPLSSASPHESSFCDDNNNANIGCNDDANSISPSKTSTTTIAATNNNNNESSSNSPSTLNDAPGENLVNGFMFSNRVTNVRNNAGSPSLNHHVFSISNNNMEVDNNDLVCSQKQQMSCDNNNEKSSSLVLSRSMTNNVDLDPTTDVEDANDKVGDEKLISNNDNNKQRRHEEDEASSSMPSKKEMEIEIEPLATSTTKQQSSLLTLPTSDATNAAIASIESFGSVQQDSAASQQPEELNNENKTRNNNSNLQPLIDFDEVDSDPRQNMLQNLLDLEKSFAGS